MHSYTYMNIHLCVCVYVCVCVHNMCTYTNAFVYTCIYAWLSTSVYLINQTHNWVEGHICGKFTGIYYLASHRTHSAAHCNTLNASRCNTLHNTATNLTPQHIHTHNQVWWTHILSFFETVKMKNIHFFQTKINHTLERDFDTDSPFYRTGVVVCCSVLQCVAVCCSLLQCVAVCCSVFQCAAVRCSVLQCIAVRCIVLQQNHTFFF